MACGKAYPVFPTFFGHVTIETFKKFPSLNSLPSERELKRVLLGTPQLLNLINGNLNVLILWLHETSRRLYQMSPNSKKQLNCRFEEVGVKRFEL